MILPLLILVPLPIPDARAAADQRFADAPGIATKIDTLTEQQWKADKIKSAGATGDTAFLRRVMLDLAGRVPTYQEATAFAKDGSTTKWTTTIRRLMESPEYALHMGRVLDEMIQEKFARDNEFMEYMRTSVAQHKPWDRIFREIMVGPWDTKERKSADRFLTRRVRNLDDLTNDTARVFFGVNIACAKCHNHPLVADWKQDHYYGMASFFFRTQQGGRGKNGSTINEKPDGDLSFVTKKGERRQAKLMFLSNKVLEEPKTEKGKPPVGPGRRERLVMTALEEKHFFSRAIVNKLWAYFLGRGLVHPVDQMHSANPPSVPGLLEWLADDLAAHGYDLDRLVAGLVSSRVYQLSSVPPAGAEPPDDKYFAVGRLRPLTPQQYALSMVLATGETGFEKVTDAAGRSKRYRELEGQATGLTRLDALDPRSDRYESSTVEALFMSNHSDVQKLTAKAGNNLVARLTAMTDNGQLVDTAIWTLLSRAPDADERTLLVRWVEERKQDRAKAVGELVWALMTSAEFRFNH
jgi:hypothetical protein